MDLEAAVRGKMTGFNEYLGLEVIELEEGRSKVKLEIKPQFYNFMKSLHGGIVFTVADVAGGVAVRTTGEKASTTMSCNIIYLSPAIETKVLYGTGEVIKHGRKTTTVDVLVTDENDKKIAKMAGTYFNLDENFKTK